MGVGEDYRLNVEWEGNTGVLHGRVLFVERSPSLYRMLYKYS